MSSERDCSFLYVCHSGGLMELKGLFWHKENVLWFIVEKKSVLRTMVGDDSTDPKISRGIIDIL